MSEFVTPWTIACQTPLSVGFFRQEYWSGLPFPYPGDLRDPEIKTPVSHALAGGFLATELLMDTCFLPFLLPFIVRSLLSPNPWDTGEPRLRMLSSWYEPGLPKTWRHGCHLWASQICKIPRFTFSVLLLALVLGYSKSNMIIDADSQGKQTPTFCTLLPCPISGLAHILGRN